MTDCEADYAEYYESLADMSDSDSDMSMYYARQTDDYEEHMRAVLSETPLDRLPEYLVTKSDNILPARQAIRLFLRGKKEIGRDAIVQMEKKMLDALKRENLFFNEYPTRTTPYLLWNKDMIETELMVLRQMLICMS